MASAALYARVSTEAQDGEDKTSITEQISDMEAHCERRGLTIVARYQEVGSGASKNRPEFQRMLADAAQGRFDTIVCWKSDRLSRGMSPAVPLMEVVEDHDVSLEAVMEAMDMKTFGLMAAIGKMELDNFRERSSMGKRGAAKQGRMPSSSIPFGYRIGADGKPGIHEEEAQVVRRIFQIYVAGTPTIEITDQMELETDLPWPDSRIHRLLKQSAYKGLWTYGKTRKAKTDRGLKVKQLSEDTWIEIPFPPLVDEETWNRVQTLKVSRKVVARRATKAFYLLQHLVRCAECGSLMGGLVKPYKNSDHLRYYRCRGMKQYKLKCREHTYVNAAQLEARVWAEVRNLLESPSRVLSFLEDREDTAAMAEAERATEREYVKVQAEEDRIVRLFASGKITERQLDHQRRFITERLETAQDRLAALRRRSSQGSKHKGLVESFTAALAGLTDDLGNLSKEEVQKAIRQVLAGVSIDRDGELTFELTTSFLAPHPKGWRRGAEADVGALGIPLSSRQSGGETVWLPPLNTGRIE